MQQQTRFRNGKKTDTKGLEFDAVLLWNPTKEQYPQDNGHIKLLYVAATRALHELTVLYQDTLTDIIETEVPKEKHMQEFQTESERIRKTGTHAERDRTAAERRGRQGSAGKRLSGSSKDSVEKGTGNCRNRDTGANSKTV